MDNEEREIDLMEMFFALLHRWWIICLAGIVCGGIGLCMAKFVIAPTYVSATSVYVVNKQGEGILTYTDLQLGSQLTKDYGVLATSRTVMEQVIRALELDMTVEELQESIAVSTVSDTRIMTIRATHTNPVMAQRIADKTRELAAEHIKAVMQVEEINVAESANLPSKKAAPSTLKYTLMGAVLGGVAAAGIIIVLYLMNDKIKTPEDVETYLHMSTLGSIPYSDILQKQAKSDAKRKKKRKGRQ